jgi:hypothetical protein
VAANQAGIQCFPTTKPGTVTLKLFRYTDDKGRHGVSCEVTAPRPGVYPGDVFPAGTGAQEKADEIAAAIEDENCGVDAVAGPGGTVTVSDPNGKGVECTKAVDATGEEMVVGNSELDDPEVTYVSAADLSGTSTTGEAMLGVNEGSVVVETEGRSIEEIFAAWQSVLGGSIHESGLVLDPGSEPFRSYTFEVTDPGLDITVRQESVFHWRDLETMDGRLTISDQGALGFMDGTQIDGTGFVFPDDGANHLFIGGLWMGDDPEHVANRDYAADPTSEWQVADEPWSFVTIDEGTYSRQRLAATFSAGGIMNDRGLRVSVSATTDNTDDALPRGLSILQYDVWTEDADGAFDWYAGLFLDLDLDGAGLGDIGGSDPAQSLVWLGPGDNGTYAGVRLLTSEEHPAPPLANLTLIHNPTYVWPESYVLDADKFGLLAASAPEYVLDTADAPDDYSVLVSAGPFPLAPGDVRRLAFAVVAGRTLDELIANADRAQELYDAPTVGVPDVAGGTPQVLLGAPNPFRSRMSFALELEQPGLVTANVYDASGRLVRALLDRPLAAGAHRMSWDGHDDRGRPLAAGVYLVHVGGPFGERRSRVTILR